MLAVKLLHVVGRVPVLSSLLRWYANRYQEASVVTIQHGEAAGYRWERHHRYVNGYWIGHYETPVQAVLKRELHPGDTFYDLGANAGFFTLIAARLVGSGGKCVAFDPLPENVESIRAQIKLNQLSQCHVVPVALNEVPGEAQFSYSPLDTARGRLGDGVQGSNSNHITIKVTTLDAAVAEWGKPQFIKMDVEGAEIGLLKAGGQTIATCRPTWLIELHGPDCEAAVRQTLSSAGYVFFELEGNLIAKGATLPGHFIARHPLGPNR